MWWGESVDKKVKDIVCRNLHICYEYMRSWLNDTMFCIYVAIRNIIFKTRKLMLGLTSIRQ